MTLFTKIPGVRKNTKNTSNICITCCFMSPRNQTKSKSCMKALLFPSSNILKSIVLLFPTTIMPITGSLSIYLPRAPYKPSSCFGRSNTWKGQPFTSLTIIFSLLPYWPHSSKLMSSSRAQNWQPSSLFTCSPLWMCLNISEWMCSLSCILLEFRFAHILNNTNFTGAPVWK